MSRYEVANHPYDRGYFDAVEGKPISGSDEQREGWRKAKSELRSERLERKNKRLDRELPGKRDPETESVFEDAECGTIPDKFEAGRVAAGT